MTRRVRVFAVALVAVVGLLSVLTTAAHAQVRDNTRGPVGQASISGVVMTDGTPSRPVRRTMVTLGSGSAMKVPMTAITGDDGVFVFRDLPAGTYTLTASRAAYVPTAYGVKSYGRGSGVPISLAAGQQLTGITLKMLHGSVLSGTLRDPSGRPAQRAEIILLTVQTLNGRRRVTPLLQSQSTDSRGEYRIYGLAPGDYIVRAQPNSQFGAGDLRPTSAAEVDWARQVAQQKSATGAPGMAAGSPASPPPPPSGQPVAYAPTYYPGTPEVTSATVITLGPDEERLGIDFSTTLVPVASLSGRVSGPDGQPPRNPQATLQLVTTTSTTAIDTLTALGGGMFGVRVGADGRLSGSGIMPGRYRLIVRGSPAGEASNRPPIELPGAAGAAAAMAGMLAGASSGPVLWASEELVVDGTDISNLDLRMQPGVSMSGTIVFEGEDPQKPEDASRVNVMVASAAREATSALEMLAGMMQTSGGRATKERTFKVNGLVPDTYRASFMPPGVMSPLFGMTVSAGGWVLKSAMLNGKDLADLPVDVRNEDITGIVVTFTKAVTEISGRVMDASGRGVAGFPIVVFPTDRALWHGGSRRILPGKPASDGAYKITGLPAGEYYVCALTELDPNDLYDSAFLDQLVAGAFKITLGEGEKKTQDLKLGGGL